MNYSKIYSAFILDRLVKQESIIGYKERHHILPKSLGGNDDADNLIDLTASDHLFAHLLLAKVHGGKLWVAYWSMVQTRSKLCNRSKRKMYQKAREEFRKSMTGENHPLYGKKRPPETLKKMSEVMMGDKNPNYGKERSKEYRRNIAAAKTGKQNGMYGRSGAKHPGAKAVRSLDPHTLEPVKEYATAKLAAKDLGVSISTSIPRCIRGERKSVGGFKWEYV